jgi:tetratricopeptide (TPR) repeat protein
LDDLDRALDAMDYALVIDENFTAAHFDRGRILEEKEEYKEAIKALRRRLTPTNPAATPTTEWACASKHSDWKQKRWNP